MGLNFSIMLLPVLPVAPCQEMVLCVQLEVLPQLMLGVLVKGAVLYKELDVLQGRLQLAYGSGLADLELCIDSPALMLELQRAHGLKGGTANQGQLISADTLHWCELGGLQLALGSGRSRSQSTMAMASIYG